MNYLKYWSRKETECNVNKLCKELHEKLIEDILYSNLSADAKINMIACIIEFDGSKTINVKSENVMKISKYIDDIVNLHIKQPGFIDYISLIYKKLNDSSPSRNGSPSVNGYDDELTLNQVINDEQHSKSDEHYDEITLDVIS